MAQGVAPFKYEEEKKDTGMTGLAGLPVYLDLAFVMGLSEMIGNHLHVKQRGWTDAQMVLSLILLNIAGGDCVEDLRMVEKDEGFCKVMRRAEQKGMTRRERREEDRRWRKERRRSVPSPSAAFRYLSNFHDGEQGYVGKGLHHLNKVFHDATPIFMICNMGIFSSLSRKDFEPVAMCP